MTTDQPQLTGQTDEEQLKLLQDMTRFIDLIAAIPPQPHLWPLTPQQQAHFIQSTCGEAFSIENTAAYKWLKVEIASGRLKRIAP